MSDARSKAELLIGQGAVAVTNYLERWRRACRRREADTCEHGHIGCAAEHWGACSDEAARLFDEALARARRRLRSGE